MAYKIFPYTYDGDQLRVVFDEIEERDAFESAMCELVKLAQNFRDLVVVAEGILSSDVQPLPGCEFLEGSNGYTYNCEGGAFRKRFNTLKIEIIMEKLADARKILSLPVFNFAEYGMNFFTMKEKKS